VRPARTTAAPGETLTVTVRGYSDQGKGVGVQGATVRLGSATATTAVGGIAVLTVPATPGTFTLAAKRAGMVPAFPRKVTVG
jgi:hypothetical protein